MPHIIHGYLAVSKGFPVGHAGRHHGSMANPFSSDGRLSASGLRRVAAEAAGAQRHSFGGGLNGYISGGGAVFVPEVPPDVEAWIKVTSATAQTIALTGGDTIKGYAAVVNSWDGVTGNGTDPTWTDGTAAVWFRGANGETPASGARYQCRLLGVDASGVAIWGTEFASRSWLKVTSATEQNINGVLCYPAVLATFSPVGGGVMAGTTTTAWLALWGNGITNFTTGTPIVGNYFWGYYIGDDGSGNPIFLNITPADASPTCAGLVNLQEQSFSGVKHFSAITAIAGLTSFVDPANPNNNSLFFVENGTTTKWGQVSSEAIDTMVVKPTNGPGITLNAAGLLNPGNYSTFNPSGTQVDGQSESFKATDSITGNVAICTFTNGIFAGKLDTGSPPVIDGGTW